VPSVPIISENDDFLVVDKPANLLVHPTKPDGRVTLLCLLQRERPGQFFALVNRLDRETSGLTLIAKSSPAASALGKMMMGRAFAKEYLALVYGTFPHDHLRVDAPIARLGVSACNPIYLKRGIVPDGEQALTEFLCLRRGEKFSLVQARPETGRLHQIRVHLTHAGFPVVGDKLYGPDSALYLSFIEHGWTAEHEKKLLLPRHALHASRLSFSWNGQDLTFTAPLPDDMDRFLKENL
jgi:23S rRNA pseudouridine1911/1915/1917 synthase